MHNSCYPCTSMAACISASSGAAILSRVVPKEASSAVLPSPPGLSLRASLRSNGVAEFASIQRWNDSLQMGRSSCNARMGSVVAMAMGASTAQQAERAKYEQDAKVIQGNVSAPPQNCCVGLGSVVKSNPICLCTLFNSSALPIQVNTTRALQLPSLCSVTTPNPSVCGGFVVAPVQQPVPSPPVDGLAGLFLGTELCLTKYGMLKDCHLVMLIWAAG